MLVVHLSVRHREAVRVLEGRQRAAAEGGLQFRMLQRPLLHFQALYKHAAVRSVIQTGYPPAVCALLHRVPV